MVKESQPDPDVVRRLRSLSLVVSGLEVRSRGLILFDHPEIAAVVSEQGLLGGARALVLRLVGHVVYGGATLLAGLELEVAGHRMRLERRSPGLLELWERDERGSFVVGVSRAARRLS